MRRLLVLGLLVAAGWWLLTRRRPVPERVVVGYVDGSAIEPLEGSNERARLLDAARGALPA